MLSFLKDFSRWDGRLLLLRAWFEAILTLVIFKKLFSIIFILAYSDLDRCGRLRLKFCFPFCSDRRKHWLIYCFGPRMWIKILGEKALDLKRFRSDDSLCYRFWSLFWFDSFQRGFKQPVCRLCLRMVFDIFIVHIIISRKRFLCSFCQTANSISLLLNRLGFTLRSIVSVISLKTPRANKLCWLKAILRSDSTVVANMWLVPCSCECTCELKRSSLLVFGVLKPNWFLICFLGLLIWGAWDKRCAYHFQLIKV